MKKEIEKKLKEREEKKKRKPTYLRTDWHKKSRLGRGRKKKQKWRRPRGRHNKIRLRRKGKPKRPEVGYGSPREVKGTINGLKPVKIVKLKDLERIDKESQIAIIDGKLGLKKKIELVKKAKELGIQLNINADEFLEKAIRELEERKARRKEFERKLKEKEKKAKEKPEKEKEKEAKKKEIEKEIAKEKEELKKVVPEVKPEKISKEKHVEVHRMALEK